MTATLLVAYYARVPSVPFGYCDFYTHCKKTPCPDSRTTFQKQHDFVLRYAPGPGITCSADEKYVVLCRNPIDSIASMLRGMGPIERPTNVTLWSRTAPHEVAYWRRFINKWVRPMHQNALYLSYEDFVEAPTENMRALIEWLTPGALNEEALESTLGMFDISVRHHNRFEGETQAFVDGVLAELDDDLKVMKLACERGSG